ncbi:MAG: hypothetical protein IJ880_00170 [Bacilli bacterium]|nr:hypothetical protein [Bacilli bacterium]
MPSEYINSNQYDQRNLVGSAVSYFFNPIQQASQSLFGIWSFNTWARVHKSTDLNVNPFWATNSITFGVWGNTFNYFASKTNSIYAKEALRAISGEPISTNRIATNWVEGMIERATIDKTIDPLARRKLAETLVESSNMRGDLFGRRKSSHEFRKIINNLKSAEVKTVLKNIDAKQFTKIASRVATFGKFASRVAAVAEPIGWLIFAVDAATVGVKAAKTVYDVANNINDYLRMQVENMRSLEFNQPLTYGYQSQPAATERQMAVRAIQQTGGRIGSYMFGNESQYYSKR